MSIVTNQQIQKKSPDRQIHRVHITQNSISSIFIYLQRSFRQAKNTSHHASGPYLPQPQTTTGGVRRYRRYIAGI